MKKTITHTALLTVILVAASATAADISAQNTRRRVRAAVEYDKPESVADVALDTIVSPTAQQIEVSGYDKPLRSRRETLFATNSTTTDICGVALTITYYDSSQRMLHRTTHHLDTQIPPQQTRQLSFPSWDRQFSFYYSHSAEPKRTPSAQPYDISITLDTIFVARPTPQ